MPGAHKLNVQDSVFSQRRRVQRDLQVFAGATLRLLSAQALVAIIDNSRLKSLLQIIETPAYSAPLREQILFDIASPGLADTWKRVIFQLFKDALTTYFRFQQYMLNA